MSLSSKDRDKIPKKDFGVPGKNKYPLDTEAHIKSAAHLINHGHITSDEKEALARKILRKANEKNMNTSGWNAVKKIAEQVPPMSDGTSLGNAPPRMMAPYYDEQDELLQRANSLDPNSKETMFDKAKRIVTMIHNKTEQDSKPPTGNQNCQLCTWCAEAQFRGMNVLPRPVYSPRDPALAVKGENIVLRPIRRSFTSQRDVVETVRGAVDSRWYVHVNWTESTGGHEFLVVNLNDYAYIMDAQAGLLKEIDESDSSHNYFRDINFRNSYMVRLDDREFNTKLFNEMNDPSKVLPWKNSLDIPYMRDNGMSAPGDDDDPRFRRVLVPSEEGTKYMKQDPELSQYWEELNKATTGEFLVDRDTGEAIGHVFVHTNAKDKGFIFNLEVNPKYRRQGYGWILTDDAVRRLGGEDLTVDADNTPAVNLYLQYGFTIYKKGQWHYDPPKDELWMKYDRSKLKQESFMDEYAKRVNDKGDPVPEKCKCGGKVLAYLRGEPVYLCEKCGKYYGTLPCNIQEGFKDSIKKIGSSIKKSITDYMTPDEPKLELKPYDGKIPYQVYVIGNTNNDVLRVYKTKSDAFMAYARQKVLKTVRQDTGLKDLYIRFERISDYYIPHSIEGVTYVSKNDAESISYDIDHVDIDGYCTTINTVNIPKEHIKTGSGNWLCIVNEPELDIADEQYFKCRFNVKIKAYDCGEYDLDRERYTEMFTQEGAFQDLKNGVNPYSDNMVFHVTPDKHVDGQIWKPRVPDYLDPYNPEDTGFEDNTTPRICFSTSIEGCLNGITVNLQRQSPDTFDKMYVYVPEKPWKEYKHKTNKQLVKDKLVYDANVTREVWIMEPVRMKLYGVIRVDQISDAKRKSVVPTSKGQKDTRNYFTYKWHWVVKPKVLKKATKFDYSPERVIDDLCIDVKKFKYGLIKDGKLQTGNVSDADYDKYWVFHSGETVDQAGGGNCYDMVEYEAGYLEAFGVPYKKYYMNFTDTKNTKTINTHTICVVPHNGKFIYIEQAFKRIVDEWGYERKKEFDKLNDIFEYVAEVTAEYENQDLNYGVWDYTNAEIDYGTPIKTFMEWIMMKCKMIYDGEAFKKKTTVKKEGYTLNRFKSRFFQEEEEVLSDTEDMEDITIGDLNLDDDTTASDDKLDPDDFDENGKAYDDENGYDSDDDSENMEDQMEVPGYMKERMSEEDVTAYEQPDEKLDANNVDLGQFGKDQSDVQNDYDQKEIDILMKLMASEADAMNEYMDGAKETNVDVLRRLYADIANEERFHMEQLLFAKSELTGEKYQPKDPEVKSEYEELLKMGMDEETAMQTAVDRCHIRGSISNDDGERTIEIQQDVETMEMAINMFNAQFDNIMMMMESDQFKREDLNHAIDVFTEACYVQEEVYNTKMDNKSGGYLNQNKKSGPVDLLKRAIGFLLRLLGQLISKFGEFLRRTRNRSNAIRNYVKRYGASALFASSKETLKMYFVDIDAPACINDATETFLSLVSDTFNATTRMIGSNFSLDTSRYNRDPRFNIGGNVEKGIQILSGVQLVKTKMLIPQDESKQEAIAACLFGYNFNQKAQDGSSYNTLNRLKVYTDKWSVVMNAVSKQLDVMNTLHTQQGSIYYRNRKKYDLAIKSFETIIKTCKAVVTALQSDINALMKLNNEAENISIKKTEEKDQNDMNAYPELKQMNGQYKQSVDKGMKK